MADNATPKPKASFPARVARAVRAGVSSGIKGVSEAWMGPMQPLRPMAPQARGRLLDYPVAWNLNYQPRSDKALSFDDLEMLSKSCGVLRNVIENRKEQIAAMAWMIRVRKVPGKKNKPGQSTAREQFLTNFFMRPSAQDDWAPWIKKILEQHFVYDAPTLYPVFTRGGIPSNIEVLDGATISVKLDAQGMTPAPPNVAYQQVLKGLPAVDYSSDQLLYYPNNRLAGEVYGYPHVEQIFSYIDLAIKRVAEQIAYYRDSNIPRGMMEGPATMTVDQINEMQAYWESILKGNIAEKSKAWWVPAGSKYTAFTQEALHEDFDEWLARVICACFRTSPTPYVKQNNRATADNQKEQSDSEGLQPTMDFVTRLMNRIIADWFNSPDLEFAFDENIEFDPQVRSELEDKALRNGSTTIDEVRDGRGQEPWGGAAAKPMVLLPTGYVPLDPEDAADLKAKTALATRPPPPAGVPGGSNGSGGVPGGSSPPLEKSDAIGPFTIRRPLLNPNGLVQWARSEGFPLPPTGNIAVTYHVQDLPPPRTLAGLVLVEGSRKIVKGDDGAAYLTFDSAEMAERWREMQERGVLVGALPEFHVLIGPEWEAHMNRIAPYGGPMLFGDEEVTDIGKVMKAALSEIDQAAHRAAYAPTLAQTKAGNYKKGHVKFQGLDITIETPAGAARRGKDWAILMPAHYGYIKRSEGADGDQVDVFLGPNPAAPDVWVIDQQDVYGGGGFDEHKCVLGCDSWPEARKLYASSFSDSKDKERIGHVTQMTMEQFKAWLKDGDTTKPLGKNVTTATGLTYYSQREAKELNPDEYKVPGDAAVIEPPDKHPEILGGSAPEVVLPHDVARKLLQGVRGRRVRPFGRGTNLPRTLAPALVKARSSAGLVGPIDPTKEAAAVERYRQGVMRAFRALLPKVQAQVRAGLEGHLKKAADDDEAWQELARRIVQGLALGDLQLLIDSAIVAGGNVSSDAAQIVLARLNFTGSSSIVNLTDQNATDWAQDRAAELIGQRWDGDRLVPSPDARKQIDQSTRDMVRQRIYEGLRDADMLDDIVDSISDVFGEKRALLIAQTEVANAHGQGALIGAKAARDVGSNVTKYWGITDDELTCELCNDNADAGDIDIDDDFPSGDDATPGHPTCRCYTGLRAIAEPDDDDEREPVNIERMVKSFNEDEPRDAHGRWTGDIISAGTTVYRGGHNQELSEMSGGKGVYVSLDRGQAGQWGAVSEYKLADHAHVLDLGDYNSPRAREFVAREQGLAPKHLSRDQFEESAPEMFIQNAGTDRVKQMGFDGYRLGSDVFLLGVLSARIRKAFDPAEPRDDHGRWTSEGGSAGFSGSMHPRDVGATTQPSKAPGDSSRGFSGSMHAPDLSSTTQRSAQLDFHLSEGHSGLARDATQPFNTKESLYGHVAETQAQFEAWLDKGTGVLSQLGAQDMRNNPDKEGPGNYYRPGMLMFLAHPKSEGRAVEKVNGEYNGRWDKLLDVVRGSVAVDKVSDIQRVLDKLSESGMQLARAPKDRISESVQGGWRGDVLLNPRMPNGMVTELQIGLKSMYAAKFGGGHRIYEDFRSIAARHPNEPADKWPESERREYTALDRASYEFYAKAWAETEKAGLLKARVPRVGWLEADNNYYKTLDGMPVGVLFRGEWLTPTPSQFAKAATDGSPISRAEARLAVLRSRRGED